LFRSNRDEDDVGPGIGEDRLDLLAPAEHGHPLQAAPHEPGVVVDEADDLLSGSLAQLAQQASPAAAGPDDQGSPAALPVLETAERPEERPLGEAGGADEQDRERRVDHVDALRE